MSDVLLTPSKSSHSYLMVPVKPVKADLLTQLKDTIYVPIATTQTYGSVKIGDGLNVDNGVISFDKSEITILSISLNGELLSIDNDKNVNIALTKNDVGLDQVDNTSDKDKPISNAQQEALNRKLDKKQSLSEVGKVLYINDEGDVDFKNVDTIEVELNDEIIDTDAGIFNFSNNFVVTSVDGGQVDIDLSEEFKESVGKIDSISLNGVPQTIDENKNVNLVIPIDNKLDKSNADRDVLTNQTISINGDNVSLVNSYINLNSLVTKTQTNNFSLANDNQAGLMSVSDYKSIRDLQARVGQLEQKATRLLYDEKLYPTAEEINTFVTSLGYTAPFEGIAVVVSGTNHIWHYYEGDVGWKDDGVDVVSQFTNDVAGIIKGAAIDGKVYAETDGTGSVYGWDELKTTISDIQYDIENLDLSDYVDLTSDQTITGIKTVNKLLFSDDIELLKESGNAGIVIGSRTINYIPNGLVAIGINTDSFSATAQGQVIIGWLAKGGGISDIAIGTRATNNATNSSYGAVAIGAFANTYRECIAIGDNAIAGDESKPYSIAIGRKTEAKGNNAISIGAMSKSSGNSSIQLGYGESTGDSAIAIGYNASSQANNAIQLGEGTNTNENTFNVWNYSLLDKNTGKIPNDRFDIDFSDYVPKSVTTSYGDEIICSIDNSEYNRGITIEVNGYEYYNGITTEYFGTNIISLGVQSNTEMTGFNMDKTKTVFSKPLYNLRESDWSSLVDVPTVTDNDMVVIKNDLNNYTPTSDLAAVALSNSYNDLDDKPIIPEGIQLYATTGQNTDGAMTQKATTDAIEETLNFTFEDLNTDPVFTDEQFEQLKNNPNLKVRFIFNISIEEQTVTFNMLFNRSLYVISSGVEMLHFEYDGATNPMNNEGYEITAFYITKNLSIPNNIIYEASKITLAKKSDLDTKVDKITGKGLSTNDYTTEEKNKLNSIEEGAEVNNPIDNSLSTTSENAVQNKVITQELNKKKNASGLLTNIYPKGSIYMSVNSTNPSTLFGGTWEQFAQGRVLLGVGSNGETNYTTAEQTGGSENSVAIHTHTQQAHNHTQQAHNHNIWSSVTDYSNRHWSQNSVAAASTSIKAIGGPELRDDAVDHSLNTTSHGYYIVKHTTAINNPTTAVNNSTGEVGGNRMPFITCYIWKRVA